MQFSGIHVVWLVSPHAFDPVVFCGLPPGALDAGGAHSVSLSQPLMQDPAPSAIPYRRSCRPTRPGFLLVDAVADGAERSLGGGPSARARPRTDRPSGA